MQGSQIGIALDLRSSQSSRLSIRRADTADIARRPKQR